jgi:hypothetical protein
MIPQIYPDGIYSYGCICMSQSQCSLLVVGSVAYRYERLCRMLLTYQMWGATGNPPCDGEGTQAVMCRVGYSSACHDASGGPRNVCALSAAVDTVALLKPAQNHRCELH